VDKESNILAYIRLNPYISQQELAEKVGISRSAVAGYIANLTKRGVIKGRAYILREEAAFICIGGANLDRKAKAKEKVRLHSSNPVLISESCGGVARNVAENLGRLGVPTGLLTCVGDDQAGHWVLQETKQHGVDVSQSWILREEHTGTYTALLDVDGEMIVALANMEIYDRFTPDKLAERWSHLAGARGIFADTNLPAESLLYLIERCREADLPLYMDPVSSAKAKKLPERLDGVDVILPNREEAAYLAGTDVDTEEQVAQAAARIRERGVRCAVITMGEQGVYCQSDQGEALLPPIPADVVDVTGAGDAFAAGFLFGKANGENDLTACRMGLAAASLTLSTAESVSPLLKAEKLFEMTKE